MTSSLSHAYLRFLRLSKALSDDAIVNLNANHRELLESIALAWHDGSPMSVRQAISLQALGSPATLHKRLDVLRTQGYLEELFVEGDKRTKLLGLTPKALNYFEQLGHFMALPQACDRLSGDQ